MGILVEIYRIRGHIPALICVFYRDGRFRSWHVHLRRRLNVHDYRLDRFFHLIDDYIIICCCSP